MGATGTVRPVASTEGFTGAPTLRGRLETLLARLRTHIAVPSTEREQIPVLMPFTGDVLGWLPRGTPGDVAAAVAIARDAQPAWAATSIRARGAVLLRFHDLLLSRQDEVLDLIQLESGKARRHALEEILDTALVARHYALHAADYLRPKRHAAGLPIITTAWEYRQPVGVVGVIAPWNFPLILSITDLLAALMAGNGVVLRPDEQSSFTALWAADLLLSAGLPRDILRVVTGDGTVLGPALVNSVDFVMFTGSTRTGRIVARQAADRLIGFSLELGGKNPMIVLDDADIEAAAAGLVRGAFVGAGQVCVSIERAYIHASIFTRFVDHVVGKVHAMILAPTLAYGVDMGSLTVPRQLATVEAHVADAVARGATLLTGGHHRPDIGPLFYEPTVLTGVTREMRLFAEETFGPVVALYPYETVDEAVALANDTAYGLNASVWSSSAQRALAVARRIRSGTVNVNEGYAGTWTATSSPIGGMKQSGFGRRHGAEGILKYTEAQTIAVQRFLSLAPLPFLDETRYSRLMPRLVGLLKHIPGLR
ncbi:MAG: Aldehyde dehydrogenase [Gemmatimonadetes bacterium]|nr:Aldehyde dehydrogenase [Gemmatimonadota bacterium]